MQLHLVVVGKAREPLAAAIAEYERRADRYWSLSVHEVREEGARGRTADQVRQGEAVRLLARVPAAATLVACDERGRRMESPGFARWLMARRDSAVDVAFVVGGAYGLDPSVRERAGLVISLAPWTLPHELARLVLAEQLYRAGTISRGEPYHK